MRESDIESYLVQRVRALGGECRKVSWLGRKGAPDRLVMLPGSATDEGCRGEKGLDHRWAQSEFSRRIYCHKCGAQKAASNTIWVELKASGEKAKPHQQREHQRMREMGQRVEVIDSMEGVDALLAL